MSIALDQAVNYRSPYEITVDSKAFRNQKTNGYSFKKNLFRKTVNIFLILSILVVGFFGVSGQNTQKADAAFWDIDFCGIIAGNGAYLNARELKVMGPPSVDTRAETKITAYEKYGTSGTNWTVWRGPEHGKDKDKNSFTKAGDGYKEDNAYFANGVCMPLAEIANAGFANGVFGLTKVVVFSSNLVYQTAYEGTANVIAPLQEQIGKMISPTDGSQGLKDTLYLDFLVPMIMFAALYMAWTGIIKRRSTEALHNAIWMLGAAITGMILLGNPMIVPTASNSIVSTVTQGIMTGVSGGTSAGLQNLGNSSLCSIDPNTNDPTSGKAESSARQTSRLVQCSIWYSFIYVPWATGQFGYSPSSTETVAKDMYRQHSDQMKGNIVLNGAGTGDQHVIKEPNWAIYQLDNQIMTAGKDNEDNWTAIPKAMLGEPSQHNNAMVNDTWSGEGNSTLISKAFFSLIAAIGAAVMIIVLGMSMIIMELGLIILMMVAPLFLLIGVHPGFGRKIALRWLETIINLTLKRIVLSALLGVMITFYSITIAIPESTLSWYQVVLIIIAISIAGIKYKDILTDMFGTIDLGGGGPIQAPPGKSGALVKGAIAGGIGAMVGGAVAGRATSSASVIKKTTGKSTGTDTRVAPEMSGSAPGGFGGGTAGGKSTGGGTTGSSASPFGGSTGGTSGGGSNDQSAGGDTDTIGGGSQGKTPESQSPDFDKDPGSVKNPNDPTSKTKTQTDTRPSDGRFAGFGNSPEAKAKRAEKTIAKAAVKHGKIETKLDQKFTKTTKTRRAMSSMGTLGGGMVKGAFMGYNGSDVGIIAMSAQSGVKDSKLNARKKINTNVSAAKARQDQYGRAWESLNNAKTPEEKAAATNAINSTFKTMTPKEKTYIKQVGQVQKKVAKAEGIKPPTTTRAERKVAPHRKAFNPNAGLPPRRPTP